MSAPEPIAIVGLAAALPGAADLDAFWDNVSCGRSAVREVPAGRWPVDGQTLLDSAPVGPDRLVGTRACFLDDSAVELGDRLAGTPLAEAGIDRLDPMVRLALRVGIDAWRSAKTDAVDPARVRVILANIALPTQESSRISREVLGRPFAERVLGSNAPVAADTVLGSDPRNRFVTGLPAGLLARALGLGGGYTLDAACASSLYALHLACEDLREHRIDAALAGGLSRPDSLYTQVGFSQLRALSPSGRCAPFDRRADGLVVGEGAGLFVLKRLGDALEQGDVIHGLIRAVGLSNDVGGSLLSPETEGQVRAMRAAYARAGFGPGDVDLVECHGTGTPRGDGVELASLRAAWSEHGVEDGCVIGSVKSNVGHLLTGAGAAGLLKVLLSLKHETLPPTASFEQAHQQLADSGFEVLAEPRPWPDPGRPRRAAVSGFGFGGINAHLLVEEWRGGDAPVSEQPIAPCPVAIVGIGARFGALEGREAFSRATLAGRSAVSSRPPERWHGIEESAWLRSVAPELKALRGAWVDRIELPFGRFRIPPNEASGTLAQQLLMLESAAEAADDAGLPWQGREPQLRTGTIVGLSQDLEATGFQAGWMLRAQARRWAELAGVELDAEAEQAWVDALQEQLGPSLDATRTLGALGGIVASRVARELRLGGPSFGVSAEGASGLAALEVALRLLQRGEVDAMVVGGVELAGDPRAVLATDPLRPWSRVGEPKPLQAGADGPVPGEGAAAVVLKRLDDALAAGDRIYAVLTDVDSAQDSWSALAPTERPGLVEVAANGDPAGDAAEFEALRQEWGSGGTACALASVRSCIGEPGAAGGLASLVRAALALYCRALPPMPGFRPADPSWDDGSFHVPEARLHWTHDSSEGPRRAAVQAASLDGARFRALLHEAPTAPDPDEQRRLLGPMKAGLFLCWGVDEAELGQSLARLRALASTASIDEPGGALARRWFVEAGSPPAGAHVRAFAALDAQALLRRLDRPAPATAVLDGELAFVFPGSGAHHLGMGAELLAELPALAESLQSRSERFATQQGVAAFVPWSFGRAGGWRRASDAALDADPLRLIFAHVSHGIAVATALSSLGLKPQAAIGYSLGESTALLASGAWPDRDAMWRGVTASPLFRQQLAGEQSLARERWGESSWAAAVLPASRESLEPALSGSATLLIVNAPEECVVGGLRRDVEAVAASLDLRPAWLRGVPTVHCDLVDPVADDYRSLHVQPTVAPPGLRVYSGHLGRSYALDAGSAADSIVGNATRGLDFDATIRQAWDDGVRVFVECGPGSSCTRMIDRILGERAHLAVSADRPGMDGGLALLSALARVAEAGAAVDLGALYGAGTLERPVDARRTVEVRLGRPTPKPPSPEDFAAKPAPRPTPKPAPPAAPQRAPLGSASPVPVPRGSSPYAALLGRQSALLHEHAQVVQATASAHGAFLARAQENLATQAALLQQIQALASGAPAMRLPAMQLPHTPPLPAASPAMQPQAPLFDRDQCMQIAIGKIGDVLGPMFAEADSFPTRVRLPDEPLMLVDRIMALEGEPGGMGSGRVVTEHDVLPGAWYLDGGHAPVCISVEAGQADLLLSGWLGIDLQTKGERVYRLLDAKVTFWRDLPRVGDTIRYDIRIDRFIRQGSTWLFFFRFEGFIGDEHLITMEDGCAGFFSTEQLASGRGLVDELGTEPPPRRVVDGQPTDPFTPLAPLNGIETLDDAQVDALRTGDLEAAFGSAFAGETLAPQLRLPGGRMRLVHRITELDPDGGNFGLGVVTGDTDVDPSAWYLTCHFVDDMVMPGTLMYEGCLHTMRVLLMRLGWVVSSAQGVHGAPIPDIGSALRCRGQVLDTTKTLTYEIHLKELGYDPEPYVLADAIMYADGKRIVSFDNVSYRLVGLDEAAMRRSWTAQADLAPWERSPWGMPALDPDAPPAENRPAIYDLEHIRAYAEGPPSQGFGPRYAPFDQDRILARLPRDPFLFVDRIVHLEPEPWVLKPGGWIEAEHVVPEDAWYFAANRSRSLPFAVLLEIALQPCGWLAAYLGSALTSPQQLHFRNLEGEATLHRELRTDAGLLTVRVRLSGTNQAGGMIIQAYDMQVWADGERVYEGWTRFGFFPTASLANQVGIRDAGERLWLPEDAGDTSFDLERPDPQSPADCGPPDPMESLQLPANAFRTIDRVAALLPEGGPAGLGWIRGTFDVDPSLWFFHAHFFQDPVIPGSLGLESFQQLLKVLALRRWPELQSTHRFEPIAVGQKHRWVYRGQIIPSDERVTVEAWVTSIDEGESPMITASGFLHVDGRTIYEMVDFTLRLVRS